MKKKEENGSVNDHLSVQTRKPLDRGAMLAAVGLMCMSWLALPLIYGLIVRLRHKEKKDVLRAEKEEEKET